VAAAHSNSASSLDCRTKLAREPWRVRLIPDAAEAVVTRRVGGRGQHSFGGGPRLDQPDFDSAGARAKRKVRRYCAANGLAYLWSATYRGDGTRDHQVVRVHVRALFRNLREVIGEKYPYLWTTEWHPGGHGLHVHFAVGRFIDVETIGEAWGQGYVFVRGPNGAVSGATGRHHGRRVGRYVAKYVAKSPAAPAGFHRYEVAQGFQPREVLLAASDLEAAVRLACEAMGGSPARHWDSAAEPNWMGSRTVWLGWP
jgi:hypothetical protein